MFSMFCLPHFPCFAMAANGVSQVGEPVLYLQNWVDHEVYHPPCAARMPQRLADGRMRSISRSSFDAFLTSATLPSIYLKEADVRLFSIFGVSKRGRNRVAPARRGTALIKQTRLS